PRAPAGRGDRPGGAGRGGVRAGRLSRGDPDARDGVDRPRVRDAAAVRREPLPRARRGGGDRGGRAVGDRARLRRRPRQALPEPRRAPRCRRPADRERDAPARAPGERVHGHRLPDPDRGGERRARSRGRGARRMNIGRVHHMGMIVPDLDRAIGGFRGVPGLGPHPPDPYGDELLIAFLPCGETVVELIRPLTEEGFSADWLASAGPGIQHVAFEVDDLEAALRELAARGVRPTGAAPRPGAGNTVIAFLAPEPFGGIIVELVQPRGASFGPTRPPRVCSASVLTGPPSATPSTASSPRRCSRRSMGRTRWSWSSAAADPRRSARAWTARWRRR